MSWIGRRAKSVFAGLGTSAILLAMFSASSALAKSKPKLAGAVAPNATTGRLYFLDTRRHQVMSANPDGSDVKVLAQAGGSPDGIAVDQASGQVYWTNMMTFRSNTEGWGDSGGPGGWAARFGPGSLQRANLDGSGVTTVVPSGGALTYRPKQMTIDLRDAKLYWSDREGMRVMRSNLDGSDVETLVETGQRVEGQRGDPKDYCVGIALDLTRNEIYWTQRGDRSNDGSIRRVSMNIPKGENPAHRTDIQVLFDGLPEPVDLALDLKTRMMYWTSDGGTGPGADTVSRAPMDPPAGYDSTHRKDQQILVGGLRAGIGISLDLNHGRMFFTDLGGNVYTASLDGTGEKTLLSEMGGLTGIAYVDGAPAGAAEPASTPTHQAQ
jgi:Low-density lipoprotein receptor repeat class B